MKTLTLLPALAAAMLPCAAMGQETAPVETRAYYSTNPGDAVGCPADIVIDGEFSDWTEDMIVTTGGANDMCNAYHGSHENCVLDMYAVYAAWDDANLYIAWQMCNTGDTWARPGDGPLTDYGRVGNVPLIVALSVDPSSPGMTGKLQDGRFIWGDTGTMGVQFQSHADHLLFMSGQPGQGVPAMFTAADASGDTNYGTACREFKNLGITYAMKEGFHPSHLWRNRTYADWADATTLISDPSVAELIYDTDSYDDLMAGVPEGLKPHDTSYDSFYEMQIPLSALGINREWLEANGIGVRVVASRGESGIDCLPWDPSMMDNVFGEYAKDNSTSHEKDDIDIITYQSASVGKMRTGEVTPLPDPQPTPGPVDPVPGPDDPTPGPVEDGNYVIYFDNSTANWAQVYTWIWDAADGDRNYSGGAWPGAAVPFDSQSGMYRYTFTCDNAAPRLMCIFNPGGDNGKTADLELVNNGIYNQNGFTGQLHTQVGIGSVQDAPLYTVSGRTLVAAEPVSVFDINGTRIATGTHVTFPQAGIYVVVTSQGVARQAVR